MPWPPRTRADDLKAQNADFEANPATGTAPVDLCGRCGRLTPTWALVDGTLAPELGTMSWVCGTCLEHAARTDVLPSAVWMQRSGAPAARIRQAEALDRRLQGRPPAA